MRPSSRFGLLVPSLLILVAAFALWNIRRSRPAAERITRSTDVSALLRRAHKADTQLSYSAISTIQGTYGPRPMNATASLVRAPRKLSITYLSGDARGMQSGFNERWFWRQDGTSPMEAYASVEFRPDEMASKRFKLMLKNYRGQLLREDQVDGRASDVVELRPIQMAEGASGPFKRLWIDRATGLTLRIDAFNHKSQPVMRSVLSKVDFTPQIQKTTFVPPEKMFALASVKPWRAEELGDHHDQVARQAHVLPPQPEFLPPGFVFDNVGVHRCDVPGAPSLAALARYTDGLNVLTVFAIKRKTKAPQPQSRAAQGQTCDFGPGAMAMRETPQGTLVAVADLPPAVLRRVLESTKIHPFADDKTKSR
jgi:negative regulator of sigma E activity